MKTISKIAWRNVWRNRMRSGVVLTSVVLGIWAGLFVLAVTLGMLEQQKRGTLESQLSHIQIHSDEFLNDIKLEHNFEAAQVSEIDRLLTNNKEVVNYTKRSVIDGTGTTAHGFSNLSIIGVDPEKEVEVTSIHERLIDGNYFTEYKNHPVLVGRQLAEDLHLEVGKTINLSFQDLEKNFIQVGFKVEGIFETPSMGYDKSNLFIRQSDFEQLINAKDTYIHEYAINVVDLKNVNEIVDDFNAEMTSATAQSWSTISPELSYRDETGEMGMMVILVIIVFALSFGIVNTMLMAVLERKREIGMLLCVGMNKRSVFTMIVMETVFLAVAATPIGLLLSWISITYFGNKGINLEVVGDALYKAGMDSMVYPTVNSGAYFTITLMIFIAALIASIIPARRALKYNPAEAVRAV